MAYLIHHMIDEAAAASPRGEAVRCREESLTYSQLVQRCNSLAHALIDQGVKPRDRVGVLLNKSVESAVAIYGTMKAGAAFVPLDATASSDRIAFLIRDCGIRHLITHPAKARTLRQLLNVDTGLECIIGVAQLPDTPVRTVSWEDLAKSDNGGHAPDLNTTEQDLAYIIYTSGSTGTPKGIMHTHRSGICYADWTCQVYGLNEHDRFTNHAPLHFDMSTFDFFTAAMAKATTVMVPEEVMMLPASYSKLLQDEKISVLFTVPFALSQLLLRGTLDSRDLSALRWIIFGGDICRKKHLRDLMRKLPHTQFNNMYGPAETNGCTNFTLPVGLDDSEDPIPIGIPSPNAEVLVVDDDDQPVPPGETGELLIRAPTMMLGYWGRPDLNKRAFYRREIFTDYFDVFYRSGDLARLLPDGNLVFLGRKDRQVKVRGYRVELDEIEAALVSHQGVEEAAAFTVDQDDGTRYIAATVIAHNDLDIAALTRHAAKRLPAYALPKRIDALDDFPRISTGKIDRRSLQAQATHDTEAVKT